MNNLEHKLNGAFLNSFRNSNQYIELEFANDLYEEIIFFIDCRITSSNNEVNKSIETLRKFDKDICEIAFFIPCNNKDIRDFRYESDILTLTFSNGYSVFFHIDNTDDESLSITLRKNTQSYSYESITIDESGISASIIQH